MRAVTRQLSQAAKLAGATPLQLKMAAILLSECGLTSALEYIANVNTPEKQAAEPFDLFAWLAKQPNANGDPTPCQPNPTQ